MRLIVKTCLYTAALAAAAAVLETPAWATVSPVVPEINGSSISTGLGLLAAGILVVRARRSRK